MNTRNARQDSSPWLSQRLYFGRWTVLSTGCKSYGERGLGWLWGRLELDV